MSIIELAEKRMEHERKKFKQTVEQLIEEAVIKNKGKDKWSDMCYMPVERTFVELQNIFFDEEEAIKDKDKLMTDLYKNASMMAAFSGWEKNNRKIKTATLQDNTSEVPFLVNVHSIFKQTGFGLYIDCKFDYAPYLGYDFMGAVVHINHTFLDAPHELELRVYFLTENKKDCFPCNLTLLNGKTLSTCLCETLDIDKKDILIDGHIPSLGEIEECKDEYQRAILTYELRYKIFKDIFNVLFY